MIIVDFSQDNRIFFSKIIFFENNLIKLIIIQ